MFEGLVIGLYDQFVHPSTMQDVRQEFMCAKYTPEMGVQGFYDTLMDYTQNMVIYPDDYQIMDKFMHGIPSDIRDKVIDCGLSPEVNSIDDLMACAKAVEISQKTAEYYQKKLTIENISSTRGITRWLSTNSKPRMTTSYVHRTQFVTKPWDDRHEEKHEGIAPQ